MKKAEQPLKALANRCRLLIVAFLKKEKEATVARIAEEIGLSLRSTSKHLRVLFVANILDREQRDLFVWYSVSRTLISPAAEVVKLL
jgi:DNA-binding transcriptional ArsR family regulator